MSLRARANPRGSRSPNRVLPSVFALVTMFSPLPVCAQPGPTERFALVVGHNESEDSSRAPLRYADDDAIATHALLVDAGVDALLLVAPDADTQRLHPETADALAPTRDRLFAAFGTLAARMQESRSQGAQVEFLFFFSGHGGIEHGEGYVELIGGRLSRGELYENILAASPAQRNHVFIDDCKSYYFAFDRGPGGERASFSGPFLTRGDSERFANTGFALSTSSDRESHEWERFGAGIFSHELRSALRGGADVDGDGRISYAELGAFLSAANRDVENPRYRPEFFVHAPGGELSDLEATVLSWPGDYEALLVDSWSRPPSHM